MTNPLGRFDASRRKFALVHNNAVRVYDVATGELLQTLSPPAGADSVNCLSWSAGKKGKTYVAIGCESGNSYVWDVDTNEAAAEVVMENPVVSISFCSQGTPTLAVATSAALKVHNVKNNALVCSGQISKGTEAVSLSGNLCAVSAKKLTVVRIEKSPETAAAKKLQVLYKFTGHTSPANWAHLNPNGEVLLTSSSSERHVSVWKVGEKGTTGQTTSLQLPDHLLNGDVNSKMAVSVTSATAIVHSLESGEPFMTIQLKGAEGSLSQVLAACFTASGVVVAKGTSAKPIFENVSLSQGTISINAMSAESTNLVMGAATKKRKTAAEAPITNKPMPAESLDTSALDSIDIKQSLGFRKSEQQKGSKSSDKIRITQSLQQALARSDKKQLDVLLDEGIARRVVDSSVADLERIYALKLLRECTKRFQHKSSRAQYTLPWIKAVIAHHPQHLLSLSDLDSMLEPLQNVVGEHLQTYSHLSNLQGRLEVVVGRSRVLKDEVVRERGQPLRIITEEDEALANSLLDEESTGDISDIDMDIMNEVLREGGNDVIPLPQDEDMSDDQQDANGDVEMSSQDSAEEDEEETDEESD